MEQQFREQEEELLTKQVSPETLSNLWDSWKNRTLQKEDILDYYRIPTQDI